MQQNHFFSHLELQLFLGGGPPNHPLIPSPLVPSALDEHQWCSMAVPLSKSRRRPCLWDNLDRSMYTLTCKSIRQRQRPTVRCQIKVHKVNFKAKIMLIFNTYDTLNLEEKIYSINKIYVWIHHYTSYHYRCSERFNPYWSWLHSNKTKMAKFALSSSLKQLP